MKNINNTTKDKDRERTHNTRYRRRQQNFAGNRVDDYVAPPERTPKPRDQKEGTKKKKNLTVEPLTKRPLYTMDDPSQQGAPVSGAGETSFNPAGILLEEAVATTTTVGKTSTNTITTASGTRTNTTQTGVRPKTSEYQRDSLYRTNGNGPIGPWTAPHQYNYYDPLGIRTQAANGRTRDLWSNQEVPIPSTQPLTTDSVKGMIGEAQEKSMKIMMDKFEQMLKSQIGENRTQTRYREEVPQDNSKRKSQNRNLPENNYNPGRSAGYLAETRNGSSAGTRYNLGRPASNTVGARNNDYAGAGYDPGRKAGGFSEARSYNDYNRHQNEQEGNDYGHRPSNYYAGERGPNQNGRHRTPQSPFRGGSSGEGSFHSNGAQTKVQLDRWNIKFEGNNVEEFWFKVDCCKEASPYTWDQVFKHFHCLLSDRLQRWYWRFRDNYRNADIYLLRDNMLDNFRARETDMDIWGLIMRKKQRIGERFDDFWKEIEDLSWRFKIYRSSEEMIQVLRANMLPEISLALTVYETTSLAKFLDKCREADKNLRYHTYAQSKFTRKINEIELEENNELPVEAIRFQYKRADERSYPKRENLTCANCDSTEHLWRDCPVEKRRIFCYKCCLQGVTTPNCSNCSPPLSENSRSSG